MSDERQPYKVFHTEEAYREHIARVVGWRIAREQAKTARAQERVKELEEEVRKLRRELHSGGARL